MKCPCCSAALGNYNNPKPISLWHKPVGGAVTGVGAGAGAGNWEQGEQGGRSDHTVTDGGYYAFSFTFR